MECETAAVRGVPPSLETMETHCRRPPPQIHRNPGQRAMPSPRPSILPKAAVDLPALSSARIGLPPPHPAFREYLKWYERVRFRRDFENQRARCHIRVSMLHRRAPEVPAGNGLI